MKIKSIPVLCVAFIGALLLVLTITVVLAYMKGQELYDTAYVFVTFFWLALIAFSALCSFIAFVVLTIIGLYKHAPRATVGWRALCVILTLLTPFCVVKTSGWTERISRRALFKNVGIEAIRHETATLTQNYQKPPESRARGAGLQRIIGTNLPNSFRKLGLSGIDVTPKCVFEITGGFGYTKCVYTFYPTENITPPPNAEKIAEGIYRDVRFEE